MFEKRRLSHLECVIFTEILNNRKKIIGVNTFDAHYGENCEQENWNDEIIYNAKTIFFESFKQLKFMKRREKIFFTINYGKR